MSQHSRLSTIALALIFALSVFAAPASAAPLSMTFTDSRANVGVQLSDDALFEAPDTAPFEAAIDPGSGSITGGVLEVPQFSTFITDPIDADVTVDFEIGIITGSFDQSSGALTLEGEAGGTLTANGHECTVSTTPTVLSLSTAGNNGGTSPRSGAPFATGLAGAGAIAGQWTDMHAAPVDPGPGGDTIFCEDVEEEIGGPGGVWLEQGGEPLSMTFTEARANVGVQLSDEALFEAPDIAPFEARIDPASGSITAGVLQVPDFSTFIEEPVDADVTVEFEIGIITGSFDQATGALTLEGDAGGTLTANGDECIVSTTPSPLPLSTAGNSEGTNPRSGVPFTAGLTGPGAIAGQWTDMNAVPAIPGEGVAVCNKVDERIGGPGGIWLEQEGEVVQPQPKPEPQPKPQLTTDPGKGQTSPPLCVVPKLAGKTLARAKAALKAADCKIGKVRKPKRHKGQGRPALVVKSSNPAAGTSRPTARSTSNCAGATRSAGRALGYPFVLPLQ